GGLRPPRFPSVYSSKKGIGPGRLVVNPAEFWGEEPEKTAASNQFRPKPAAEGRKRSELPWPYGRRPATVRTRVRAVPGPTTARSGGLDGPGRPDTRVAAHPRGVRSGAAWMARHRLASVSHAQSHRRRRSR